MDTVERVQVDENTFVTVEEFVTEHKLVSKSPRQVAIGPYTVLVMDDGEVIKCFLLKFYRRGQDVERWKVQRTSRGATSELILASHITAVFQR